MQDACLCWLQGGDLHEALMQHDCSKLRQESITWYNRGAKIALDVARGLQYLHGRKVPIFGLLHGGILHCSC